MGNKSPGVFSSEHSRPTSSMSQSTSHDDGGLLPLAGQRRLSTGTAATTPLPPSSPIDSHIGESQNSQTLSPSNLSQPLNKTLRKTPSASSLGRNERSTTPILHKRLSITSLNGASSITPPRSPAFRRVSSTQSVLSSDMRSRSGLFAPPEEPVDVPVTAASVARDFFQRELEAHHGVKGTSIDSEIVVILQDNCYGHRFSRPRTSKASLSTIVERPERIHASILGLATAYVWLGGRHAEGTTAPHPNPDMITIPSVPFRIHKTTRTLSLNSPAATTIHGGKWMDELRNMCESAELKLASNGKELARSPTAKTAGGNLNSDATPRRELHEGDLYLCSGSLSALEGALGGVCEGVDAVFAENSSTKRAFVCIRPPGHHCSADYPSGFCWLNNVHVGISHASLMHGLTHAAIIDFDLHHGDGSQAITWEHNSRISSLPKNTRVKKTAIGYFSLHDINSYPCEMGDEDKVRNASLCLENAHGQSIWNVHLQPWKSDAEFWDLYEDRYSIILSKARAFLKSTTERFRSTPNLPTPKAAIFLSAGFDASEWESPGMQRHQVNVPTDFYARFTRDVVALADEEGIGVDGRVISVLEGGYSDRALMSGVLSHISGLTTTPVPEKQDMKNGLAREMSLRLGNLNLNGGGSSGDTSSQLSSTETYDPRWWALARLEEIENKVKPPAPAVSATKKSRNAYPPTYTSSTQSYTAKIVPPTQTRRSLSGSNANGSSLTSISSRPPTPPPPPPPPAVDWATAAHELSKLLIPLDRQTRSCQPEELNAEASRARKDRHSVIGLPIDVPAPEGRMQLRDRRTKPPPKYVSDEEEDDRPVSRSSRRKTMANVVSLNQELQNLAPGSSQAGAGGLEPRQPARRRVSVASSISSLNSERVPSLGVIAGIKGASQQDQITVRKTRAPGNSLAEAKPRVIRKPAPGSRMPSGSGVISEPKKPSTTKSSSVTTSIAAPSSSSLPIEDREVLATRKDLKNLDVDVLTSGMKKMSIKLNLPSKEEQEAREAARLTKPTRGRPKSAVTKTRNPREPAKAKQINNNSSSADVTAFKANEEPPLSQETQTNTLSREPATDKPVSTMTPQVISEESAPLQGTGSQASYSPYRPTMPIDRPPPPSEKVKSDVVPSAPSSLDPHTAGSVPASIPTSNLNENYTGAPISNQNSKTSQSPLPPLPNTLTTHESSSPPRPPPPPKPQQSPPPPPLPPKDQNQKPKHAQHPLPIFTSTSPLTFATTTATPNPPSTSTSISTSQATAAAETKPNTATITKNPDNNSNVNVVTIPDTLRAGFKPAHTNGNGNGNGPSASANASPSAKQ